MTRRNFRRILTALLLTAFLGPMTNAAPSAQLALIPNPTTEVKELILEAFLFPDDYRERIAEYCSNLTGLPTGIPVPLTAQSLKPSTPQARTFKTEYETLIKAPNPQQNGQKGNGGKGLFPKILETAGVVVDAYGLTAVGRAFQKHASRGERGTNIWGKIKGGNPGLNKSGTQHLDDILYGPGDFIKNGNYLEKFLPDGRGVRVKQDGSFVTFLD